MMSLPFVFPDLTSMLQWFSSNANITVTYEALDTAAADTLAKVTDVENACQDMLSLISQLQSAWDAESGDSCREDLRENVEALQEIMKYFRGHASNLRQIAQNYITGSSKAASAISTLSDETII